MMQLRTKVDISQAIKCIENVPGRVDSLIGSFPVHVSYSITLVFTVIVDHNNR
jgi:hypothetical protein